MLIERSKILRNIRCRRYVIALATLTFITVATLPDLIPVGVGAMSTQNEALDSMPAWNQWRGSDRDGRVEGPVWPIDLDGLTNTWRVELGKGYGGPIVTDKWVFVVETTRKARRTQARVKALNRQTGKEIWRHGWDAMGDVPFFAETSGAWERSTPAFDGETLYVGDMKEVLHALDGETGEERWTIDFPKRFGVSTPAFGFASSPLLVDNYLYVQAANGLVKVNTATGNVLWRTATTEDSIMTNGAFSSPVLASFHGVLQVIAFTRSQLTGVDPESGRILWQHEVPNFRGMNIVTPAVHDDGIFISQYRNGSFFFQTILSKPGPMPEFQLKTTWTNKSSGYMSSPVIIGDQAFQHLGNRRLSSINLLTGVENWRTKPMGEYWSMVWQGDRILALDSEGTLRLVRATPRHFELIDERQVVQTTSWGHLAVSGNGVFIRELQALSAFTWNSRRSN